MVPKLDDRELREKLDSYRKLVPNKIQESNITFKIFINQKF